MPSLKCQMSDDSSPAGVLWPRAAFDQNLAIRRHTRLRGAIRSLDQELYTHDLLHALIAKVGVFRSERGLRIDARNVSVDCDFRVRIEIDVRRLIQFHASDVAFGHKAAQIN